MATTAQTTIRFGKDSDFEKLQPLLRRNAQKLQINFDNYCTAAKLMLQDRELGFILVAEQDGEFVAFMLMNFEWSDWRDGSFLWVQGLDSTSKDIAVRARQFRNFKAFLLENMEAATPYKVCGFRLIENILRDETEEALALFDLKSSGYIVYN